MKAKVVVMGCGRIGSTVCRDLARSNNLEITAVDTNRRALSTLEGFSNIRLRQAGLMDRDSIRGILSRADLVVDALPGRFGMTALRSLIEAAKPVVDVSFMPENPFDLDRAAREKRVTVIVDAGVAPGLSHILAATSCRGMDRVKRITILVGGVPQKPRPPWNYFTVFSLEDLLEEYVRPARMVRHGQKVDIDPLSKIEKIELPQLGNFEAFYSDGLRTLIETIKAEYIEELTLRHPGHLELIRVLKDSGFLSGKEIAGESGPVIPLEFTARLLKEAWRPLPNDMDMTILQVSVEASQDGEEQRITHHMVDRQEQDPDGRNHGIPSMSRTTGYTCASLVRLYLEGMVEKKGIVPPEEIGSNKECVSFILSDLSKRGIKIETGTVTGSIK
ncbi:MAG: saccharopine dehydrogenase [Deltaproteobacteria bacterium]|nr:saccharopine dehydrogenase [Deltaproteobacteria bacterium]